MKTRILVFGFFALAGMLAFTPARVPAAIDFSGWHMPLPQGTWWVYQSPKDSLWDCAHPNGRTHCGTWWEDTCAIDIWSPDQTETPILAPARGQVILARQRSDTAGRTVKLKHDNGVISTFFHLDQISVSENITVEAGTKLGYMGKSGSSAFDVHLHFVLLKGDGSQGCESMRGLDGFYPPAPDQNNPNGLTYFTSTNLPIESIDRSDKRIGEPILSPPQLWSPGSGQNFRNVSEVIVHWNPSAYVTQYQVEYRADALGTRTSSWINGLYFTINPAPPGAYTWRVQARNARGRVSEWSAPWSFSVEGSAPPVSQPAHPTLASPRDGFAFSTSDEITLAWNPAANATQYKVETFGSTATVCDWTSDTACRIGRLTSGNVRWRVKARNANGVESEWSDTWSFTVQPAPRAITETPTATPTRPSVPIATKYDLQLIGALSLSTTAPQIDESVTAVFKFRNVSTRVVTIEQLVASARGPNARSLDWSAPVVDFPARTNIALQPGAEYEYRASRSFAQPGDYFAEPTYYDPALGKWEGIPSYSRVWFDTRARAITVTPTPTRTTPPPMPTVTPTRTTVPSTPTPTRSPTPPSPTGNLAPRARREPDGINSGNAFDGNLGTFWTNGLGHRFNLRLTLQDAATIHRILVWDRPQNSPDNQQINKLILSLSNGWSKQFDMNSGGPRCIDVTLASGQRLTWVNLKADDASGNNGLSQVEIWAGNKTTGINCANKGNMP